MPKVATPPIVYQPSWRGLDLPAVAGRIKEARLAAGLSQREAAFEGCSAAYISRLEAGERVPSGHLLEELASRLSTTRPWLETGTHPLDEQWLADAKQVLNGLAELPADYNDRPSIGTIVKLDGLVALARSLMERNEP